MTRKSTLGTVLVVAATLLATAPAASAWPACVARSTPVRTGVSEAGRTRQGRLLTLTLRSRAMQDTEPVDVLLPRGYDPSGGTRYPVLYLLHGALDDETAYAKHGIARIAAGLKAIVVMPNGGKFGAYSDWAGMVDGAAGPTPAWESFHLRELIPFVDAHFPTLATAGGRAVAGLSMGGAGAMKYAAAHPGVFGFAGSFSGAVDIDLPGYPQVEGVTSALSDVPGNGPPSQCKYGDPAIDEVTWRDNDATELASNLKGIGLFVASGNGEPGPFDPPGRPTDPVESVVGQMSERFVAALDASGIPHTVDLYGPGTHSWPYWERDLRAFVAWLRPRLGAPVRAPASFDYRSARPAFSAWGWSFRVQRDVKEFMVLTDVSKHGLSATGSGTLDVVTPGGRRFKVDLGPSHTAQQSDFGPDATDGWETRRLRIR